MPARKDRADAFVEGILNQMTLEQKVGQCFTLFGKVKAQGKWPLVNYRR
jgi:hypothetical protein